MTRERNRTDKKNGRVAGKIATAGAVLALVLLVLWPLAGMAQPLPERRISVQGEGRVEAAPDMATISLGVTNEARTAGAALSENAREVTKVLDGLRAAGIAERDLQTTGLSLGPRWEHPAGGRARIVGFTAANMITVRVRALPALGGILDQVVTDGANTFNGLQFGLAESEALQDEARRRAVADARRKAELFAEAAGVALGPVVALAEQGGGRPQPVFAREMSLASDQVPVAGGEVVLSAQVSIVYSIVE